MFSRVPFLTIPFKPIQFVTLLLVILVASVCTSELIVSSPLVGPSENQLSSLRLIPKKVLLQGKNASQQFLLIGTLKNGREKDFTNQAKFTLSNSMVASLGEPQGKIKALNDGKTTVLAMVGRHSAKAVVSIKESDQVRPFSFARKINGIFTRRGCNDVNCHAGVKGQGGFKLSVNAAHPQQDYDWIINGGIYQVLTDKPGQPRIPRINLKNPEQSLILKKATLQIPHGGGLRIEKDSGDYRTILEWIQKGAHYSDLTDGDVSARVVQLEVNPREVLMQKGEFQNFIVTAQFADGRSEDFTSQVRFESKQGEVAEVVSQGMVEAFNPGETAILVRGSGFEVRSDIGVVAEWIPDYPEVPKVNFIDEQVFSKLRKFNILPSGLSSDTEFLRRVCLDLTGQLPPKQKVREFLSNNDPKKREQLIKILIDSPEFVDYWTFRFADLFRVAVFPVGINPKWTQSYWEWIRNAVAQNLPYDQVARERIAAQGYSPASRHYLPYLVIPPPENMMGEEVRVFFGRRLDCAQCHDHPYESWTQDQFWGMAAFFGSMFKLGGNERSVIFDHPGGREVAPDVPSPTDLRTLHPRTGQEVTPTLLNGTQVAHTNVNYPRGELAQWMTAHPYFSEAAVNRLWSYFFGRGIVNPVDDFHSTNPPTHPELLRLLAEYFSESGYNIRSLFQLIVSSRTYQLTSASNDTNRADLSNYSHALSRPLNAEILLDAICDVTGVPEIFDNWLHKKKGKGAAPKGTRAVQLKETDLYASTFLDTFGRPNRFSIPERNGKSNLSQALHLLVGSTYNDKLWTKGGHVYKQFKGGSSDRKIIEDLYLAAYSRIPSAREIKELKNLILKTSTREQALKDLQWSIISSREFAENH